MPLDDNEELKRATTSVLESKSKKRLVIAGPGAGKTFLFKELLKQSEGNRDSRLVVTFVNNLKADLEVALGDKAVVSTLHGFCQRALHGNPDLRGNLAGDFRCYPGLAGIIQQDWAWLKGTQAPTFIKEMRKLQCPDDHVDFYVARSDYYAAVDFDDSVFRVHRAWEQRPELVEAYDLVLIDEYQDFNGLEAGIVTHLSNRNSIVIAGDDDQALYSKLRDARWDYIRALFSGGAYEAFFLPFCLRCPEVIVNAIGDVIRRARAIGKLDGRIDKPYRYHEPIKGADSQRFPTINRVVTSVQRDNANYFGRYIEKLFRAIPAEDLEKAKKDNEPALLIIGSKPYSTQIKSHLVDAGLMVDEPDDLSNERDEAFEILKENPNSNLGWRIILSLEDENVAAECVRRAAADGIPLIEAIDDVLRQRTLAEVETWTPAEAAEAKERGQILLTSYEGSKGLSAQYVVLVGLQEGNLPLRSDNIQDIEICRFLVGLTRTKKQCTILTTRNFAGQQKRPSLFLGWINAGRYQNTLVDAGYWNQ